MKKHVCSQLTWGWWEMEAGGGWGTKTTSLCPICSLSDRQGSDTASQDGSPTPHEASRRHQPTLFCFQETSAHSVLFISQFPTTIKLNARWCPIPSESACRSLYSAVYLLSPSTLCCLCPQVVLCGCFCSLDATVLPAFLLLVIERFCVSYTFTNIVHIEYFQSSYWTVYEVNITNLSFQEDTKLREIK